LRPEETVKHRVTKTHFFRGLWAKVLVPVGILIIALVISQYLTGTRREAQKHDVSQRTRLVEVFTAEQKNIQTLVNAMGTVIPAREVTLMPQVSGQVISLSPYVIAGSLVDEGTKLLEIDARDYEFAIQQCRNDVAQAQLDIKLEQGNRVVARAEYEMLGELISQQDRELVLREFHLKQAEAALEASKAALAQARLNRDRCQITAPFNGIVRDKYIDLGASATPSTELLTIIGTDEYWIEVVVRADELGLIQIPGSKINNGSTVRVFDNSQWDPDTHRRGHVIRLLPELETNGRMARLLVSVQDPLSLNADDMPSLLIGSYVHVEIVGRTIDSVIPLDEEYLRNGNTVWIMNQDNCLEIRPVRIAYRDQYKVYISQGLDPTDRIVVTNIETPVENMPLSLESYSMDNTPNLDDQEESR
jgi:RND family efflux transporter MFP subunit